MVLVFSGEHMVKTRQHIHIQIQTVPIDIIYIYTYIIVLNRPRETGKEGPGNIYALKDLHRT